MDVGSSWKTRFVRWKSGGTILPEKSFIYDEMMKMDWNKFKLLKIDESLWKFMKTKLKVIKKKSRAEITSFLFFSPIIFISFRYFPSSLSQKCYALRQSQNSTSANILGCGTLLDTGNYSDPFFPSRHNLTSRKISVTSSFSIETTAFQRDSSQKRNIELKKSRVAVIVSINEDFTSPWKNGLCN